MHKYALPFTFVAAFIVMASAAADQRAAPASIWPTTNWVTSTPESQGLDSGVLADMVEFVGQHNLAVHNIVIVRHGRLVLDAAFYPYDGTYPHDIASATKSVTSLLAGIAIDKGFIKSVHEHVNGLLPGALSVDSNSRQARLTVEHLLTMTSGFDCGLESGERELARMRESGDWAAFALALPMGAEPGTRYAYCSCNSHLLSAIISARTGESSLVFAQKYLFEPLGIQTVIWPVDPQGRARGWGDLHLYPRDLARIGYLMLHRGRWNGRQVVSEDWVRQSTTPFHTVREGVGYGYQWWVNTARTPPIFEAVGRGGQRVAVLSDKDLVVVFNSGGVDTDAIAPFLFRAIRSDGSLPENPVSSMRLRRRLLKARQTPASQRPETLPALARKISGVRYEIDANPLKLRHLSLTFSGRTEARATLGILDGEWTVPIGLDGHYRFSSGGPEGLPIAASGAWVSRDEFVLNLNTVANINHFTIRTHFIGERLELRIDEATGELNNLIVRGINSTR